MGYKALAAALLLLCITAGAKADDKPTADLLFVLSADQATFTTATSLTMQNVSATAQFYGKGARAGVTPTGAFVNSTAGAQYVAAASGMWLNNPTATVYGFDANNTGHAVILTLANPTANSAEKTVTFDVGIVADKSAIKTSKGVANEEEESAANQAGYLLTSVQPETVLREVAIFIDVNSESVQPDASEKTWFRPYYGGYGCGWGCGGGYGYRRDYGYGGYNRGWGGGYGWGK